MEPDHEVQPVHEAISQGTNDILNANNDVGINDDDKNDNSQSNPMVKTEIGLNDEVLSAEEIELRDKILK